VLCWLATRCALRCLPLWRRETPPIPCLRPESIRTCTLTDGTSGARVQRAILRRCANPDADIYLSHRRLYTVAWGWTPSER